MKAKVKVKGKVKEKAKVKVKVKAKAKASQEAPTLTISPSSLVLGLPGDATVDVTMEIWAVDSAPGTCPAFLRSEATWRSLDTDVVTVNRNGVLTPVAAGVTTVEATVDGVVASTTVTVAGTLHARTIDVDGVSRSWLLYVPSTSTTARPLVLSLHGGGGTAQQQLRTSQLPRVAFATDVLVAFADGSRAALPIQTWNGGTCCGAAAANDVDDVGFLVALVAAVADEFAVDATRVFSTGHSNGGIMSHRLACAAADVFAAIAPVDGGLNVDGEDFVACAPSRPVPVLMFHGTTDVNYPLLGGVGGIGTPGEAFYPVQHPTSPNTLADWRRLDDAEGPGTITLQQGIATCETFTGAADVVFCGLAPTTPLSDGEVVCDGGGHAWPGGVKSLQDNADVPTVDIDGSAVIVDFFLAHPMSVTP